MKKILLSIRKKVSPFLRELLKCIVGWVPKDKNLILFSAWFGEKYADSTMYLFEYMLEKNSHEIYWFTKNEELYKELKQKGKPVLYSNTFKAKWKQCRAVMLLSTVQTSDYNPRLLNRCIFFDLDHGFPGKPVALAQPTVNEAWRDFYYFCLKGLKFYQTASSKFVVDYLSPCYDLNPSHYIFANKPRIDVLFNHELWEGKNAMINELRKGHKIISYLPTHRLCGKKAISLPDIFDLSFIQSVCEKNNAYFIIKKHFYHRHEIENLSNYSNILDLTSEPLDTQVLLAQSDVLITDFSSCFNDYLALNRPIMFYAYDYDDYLANDRDYYWKYDKISAGYTSKTKDEFNCALQQLSQDWKDDKHANGRNKMRRLYFDDEVEMGTSREKLCIIIDQLINGTYIPFDWSKKESFPIES